MTTSPLTSEEKQEIIHKLCKNFKNKGKLLLPDEELYPENFNEQRLTLVAKKIFVWLGVKPHDLLFGFDANNDHGYIKIPLEYRTNTYECTAYLALFSVEYLFQKKNLPTEPELRELALIELGLGLLMINSFDSNNKPSTNIRRLLGLKSHGTKLLKYYSADEFARRFCDYIGHNELHHNPVIEHTLYSARPYISALIPKSIIHDEPYVRIQRKELNLQRIKVAGALFMTIFVCIAFILLLSMQPKKLSTELQIQKDTIEVLDTAYRKCRESFKLKSKEYDTTDIFIERQLDAHASRCKSIKNKHDFMVTNYNKALVENDYL